MPHPVLDRTALRAVHPVRQTGNSPAERAARSRVIVADHDRLVVTYSAQDDTVYLLRPPGADPRVVLAAARVVLHDDIYRELAAHLGVAPGWDTGLDGRGHDGRGMAG